MSILRTGILLLSLVTFSIKLKAKANRIDSLKNALKLANHDTSRCTILNALIEAEPNDKIWPQYNAHLFNITEINLKKAGNPFRNFYLKKHAIALSNIGFEYNTKGEIRKAIEYFNKALTVQEEISDKPGIANSLLNIGAMHDAQGDVLQGLEYYHRSLKIQEEIKDKQYIANSLNNIGFTYYNQGYIDKALEYYSKSLKIREEMQNKEAIASSLSNIAAVYDMQGDFAKALEYYRISLKMREEIHDNEGIASSLNKIGNIYNKQGDIYKALEYCTKSLKIREDINDKEGIALSFNNIATIYFKQNNFDEAFKYANLSLKISKELSFPESIRNAAFTLKNIFQKQNKYRKSLEMYELYIQMRDSINNEETKKVSLKKQFQYQYEKKAAADSVKNAEEQKVKNAQLTAQQAQLKQEKIQRYSLYGGLLLVVAFLVFVFNRFKITKRQKAIIENQKDAVDVAYKKLSEKNKEVMDSIHYARKIQNALLTPEKYIAKQINRLTENKNE